MKKALIFEGKIVQIESITFPVAPELKWMDVADDVSSETHQVVDGVILLKPVHIPTYSELRQAAYAPLAEQLDMQYHDTMNGTETWLDHIKSVKEAHPKEGE